MALADKIAKLTESDENDDEHDIDMKPNGTTTSSTVATSENSVISTPTKVGANIMEPMAMNDDTNTNKKAFTNITNNVNTKKDQGLVSVEGCSNSNDPVTM